MTNLTTVGLTAGAGSSGTGNVSTLDNVIAAAGSPNTNVQTVQGITSMTPLAVTGATGSDASTTVTTGGTAQNLFSNATPSNGFAVYNPDPTEDLWISMSTTASANGTGCIRVAANGGGYETPPNMKPFHAISLLGATTGHKFTAVNW